MQPPRIAFLKLPFAIWLRFCRIPFVALYEEKTVGRPSQDGF